MDHDEKLREQLLALLKGGQAHDRFEDVVAEIAPDRRGLRPHGVPHSAWHLLEHIRIAQRDILDFCRDPAYQAPDWPDDYWPPSDAPPSDDAWDHSVAEVRADAQAMMVLVSDPNTDLYAPFSWGEGQNVLREALLVADHNAWHLGQLALLKRLLH